MISLNGIVWRPAPYRWLLQRQATRLRVALQAAWLLFFQFMAGAVWAAELPPVRTFAEAGLPALSAQLEAMQHFYKIAVLPDGYPGRSDGFAHPIYGPYV